VRFLAPRAQTAVAWDNVCWGIELDGLFNRVTLLSRSLQMQQHFYTQEYRGSAEWAQLPPVQCAATGLDTSMWQHVAVVVEGAAPYLSAWQSLV
jgi:hypothetical protein